MATKQKNTQVLRVSEVHYHFPSEDSAQLGLFARIERRISNALLLTALARLSASAFVLVTGTFFLLSSFVFSWLNIVKNENVLWIPKLAHIYTPAYWIVFALNALTVLPAFRRRTSRWLIESLLIVLGTIGLALTRIYQLTDLPAGPQNIALSVVVALPLFCFGLHDIVMFGNTELWRREGEKWYVPLRFPLLCGGTAAIWYAAIALFRHPELRDLGSPLSLAVGISAFMQACTYAFVAGGLACLALLGRIFNPKVRWLLTLFVLWIAATILFRKLVAPALSFNSGWADVWAALYPIPYVVALAGWQVRFSAIRSTALPGRVEEALSALLPKKQFWTAAAFIGAILSSLAIPILIERVDWNFLFQRTAVIAIAVIFMTVTWRCFSRPAQQASVLKPIVAFVVAGACLLAIGQSSQLWQKMGWRNTQRATVAYSSVDVSFQVGQLFFRPAIHDKDTTGLFPYLRQNALIGDPIGPPSLKLTQSLTPTTGIRPNIFIVVVDCMRRDYLSVYNPRVTFTPNMKEFAKESFVFENAYTQYGGTAISEPAIWAGAMTPSKHYVAPFSEINALEKLTTTDGYDRAMTADFILKFLLTPKANDKWMNLFGQTQYWGLDFRDTVRQLNNWQSTRNSTAPAFVYTQPQNLHPITLHELSEKGNKISNQHSGFNERYADELQKVDQAFGQFVSSLKSRGEFDNSIVILTADHGEWLGEYGRWGHAQSLLPPVMEVPLLIHLPKSMVNQFYVNTKQTVFLTDITPSLYYLLGHRDLNKNEFFGRPLFTLTAAEQTDYHRQYHLMMSSYGAVFAILDEDNHMLYQADAVDDSQSLYNTIDDHYGIDNLLEHPSQTGFEALTRDSIQRLNELYGYKPAQH